MDPDLEALIAQTEALGWDDSDSLLESISLDNPNPSTHGLVGQIISQKPLTAAVVRSTTTTAWSFAAPFTFEEIAPYRYLFAFSKQQHVDRILSQTPWNIRGSLLALKRWSPLLALKEIEIHSCAFWVQIHGLPLMGMTIKTAIRIGKALGNILEVDDLATPGIICRGFLRIRVELDTRKSLVPGFNLPRRGLAPARIQFKFERLSDYCNNCGLINHKRPSCPLPLVPLTQDKYGISLKASTSSRLHTASTPQGEKVDAR